MMGGGGHGGAGGAGGRGGWQMMRSFQNDRSVTQQKLTKGTVRRIIRFAAGYRGKLIGFLVLIVIDAVITAVSPLIVRAIINGGIIARNERVVVGLALLMAGLAIFDSV